MAKTTEQMNLFERLYAITNEIKGVAKNLSVGYGQSKYKAVAEGDVLKAVKDAENKYRVYSFPETREIVESRVIEKADGKLTYWARIKTQYRFVNIDNPNESISMISFSDGMDAQDKAMGKAMTYADKYCLLKAYKIETGDDPDQFASEETTTGKKKQDSKQPPKTATNDELIKQIKAKWTEEEIATWLNYFKANALDDLNQSQLNTIASRERKKQ